MSEIFKKLVVLKEGKLKIFSILKPLIIANNQNLKETYLYAEL